MGMGAVGLLRSTPTSLGEVTWSEAGYILLASGEGWGWLWRAERSGPHWKAVQGVQNQPAITPLLTQLSRPALGAWSCWMGGRG